MDDARRLIEQHKTEADRRTAALEAQALFSEQVGVKVPMVKAKMLTMAGVAWRGSM